MCISPEVDAIKSEDAVSGAGEEENGSAEGTDSSMVRLKARL